MQFDPQRWWQRPPGRPRSTGLASWLGRLPATIAVILLVTLGTLIVLRSRSNAPAASGLRTVTPSSAGVTNRALLTPTPVDQPTSTTSTDTGKSPTPAALTFPVANSSAGDDAAAGTPDALISSSTSAPGGIAVRADIPRSAFLPGFPGAIDVATSISDQTPPPPPAPPPLPTSVSPAVPSTSPPAPVVPTIVPTVVAPTVPPTVLPVVPTAIIQTAPVSQGIVPVKTTTSLGAIPSPFGTPAGVSPVQSFSMTLDVAVFNSDGMPVARPRVQAYAGSTLCDDEMSPSSGSGAVRISLPGPCQDLAAGTALSFRAGGVDPVRGAVDPPLDACPTAAINMGAIGSYNPVLFQPGATNVPVFIALTGSQPLPGCPAAPVVVSPAPSATAAPMLLSLSVRTADRPDPLTAPMVRVYNGAQRCAEGSSGNDIVVKLTVPATCGQAGDLLTFEAGGQDSRTSGPIGATAACPFELLFGEGGQSRPAYQPVAFGGGERYVPLVLGTLLGCAAPPAAPVRPASDTAATLLLRVVNTASPASPLQRPAVTVAVDGTPCAQSVSLDTQFAVLTLPPSCGHPGAPLSFRASALDPRYTATADQPACALETPPPVSPVISVPTAFSSLTLQPGSTLQAILFVGNGASCPQSSAGSAAGSVTATPAAATLVPTASPAPTPSATPAATVTTPTVQPTPTAATPAATATPLATVVPQVNQPLPSSFNPQPTGSPRP